MANPHSREILQAYREVLKLIRRLPREQIENALNEAKSVMRSHQLEMDPARRSDLYKQLAAKISFLRMITPRVPGDQSVLGACHYVLREGNLVEGYGENTGSRVADGKLSMAEAHEYHNRLLKRQYFGKDPPKYSPSSF